MKKKDAAECNKDACLEQGEVLHVAEVLIAATTALIRSGYVGNDLHFILRTLLYAADDNIDAA